MSLTTQPVITATPTADNDVTRMMSSGSSSAPLVVQHSAAVPSGPAKATVNVPPDMIHCELPALLVFLLCGLPNSLQYMSAFLSISFFVHLYGS